LCRITNLTTIRDPDALISVLGDGRKVKNDDGVFYATQMSIDWVLACLNDLECKQEGLVTKIRDEWVNKNPPKRVLNIYGGIDWNAKNAYDDLVKEAKKQYDEAKRAYDEVYADQAAAVGNEQKTKEAKEKLYKVERKYGSLPKITEQSIDGKPYQASKGKNTGKKQLLYIYKEWRTEDPKKGLFYLLPGKYEDTRARLGFLTKPDAVAGPHEVDFADDKFRENEFFELDELGPEALATLDKLKEVQGKDSTSMNAVNDED
jgi:hypothetical protein